MSPSRGAIARLLRIGNAVRPSSDRSASRANCRHIQSAQYSQSIALSLHNHNHDHNQEIYLHRQEVIAGPSTIVNSSNNSLHPDGIDASLFESTTDEYHERLADSDARRHLWHDGPSDMLSALLKEGIKQATSTMKELRNLRDELEHRIEFAGAARQCAVEEDYEGCLHWLEITPNYYKLEQSENDKEQLVQDCGHVALTLSTLINSRADPYVVCVALLKIISKGYLEADKRVQRAIQQTMTWLIRHGRVKEDGDAKKWTWQLWQSVSKLSLKAREEFDPEPSDLALKLRGKGLEAHLFRAFNACLRTLCVSGKFEAAIAWIKNSQTFGSDNVGTHLQYFTWKLFLEEILDRNSPASDSLRSQAGALAAEIQTMFQDAPPKHFRLRALARITRRIVIDRNAVSLADDLTLDEKVTDALDCNDRIAAIAFLHQALLEQDLVSRWSHLPKASTLATLRDLIEEQGNDEEKKELQAYLMELKVARGAKGLIPLSTMLRYSQKEQHVDCVSHCIETFQCRELEELAVLVDSKLFSADQKPTTRLQENKYASYLALKSLLYYCKNDFNKINKVYQAWLESISHHRSYSREVKAQSNGSIGSIYEDVDDDYLFMGNLDLDTQDLHDTILHRTPPNSKPTIYHFNLFLKMVPMAFGVSARNESSSMKSLLTSGSRHEKSIEIAFQIIHEMHNFQVEPNTSTWSILLTLMARNINATSSSSESPMSTLPQPPSSTSKGDIVNLSKDHLTTVDKKMTIQDEKILDDSKQQWKKIWSLTSALGMGPNHLHTPNSFLPKATALTYASLIQAFLKVPKSRGGPCLTEATQVKRWLLEDKEALRDLKRYQKSINRILHLHRKVTKRIHENKMGRQTSQLLSIDSNQHHASSSSVV